MFAQKDSGITIDPAFMELRLSEDSRVASASVMLRNSTSSPLEFKIYVLDIKQTNDRGEIAFFDKPQAGNQFALSSFMNSEIDSITMQPQDSKRIPFIIRNSPDLSPGGHYAAVIAQLASAQIRATQEVLPALSSVVLLRKEGGERYHLSLVEQDKEISFLRFSFPRSFNLSFSNEGNVHVTPRGSIEFRDIFGKLAHKGIINEGSLFVLPQVRRSIPVTVKQVQFAYPAMLYAVTVAGHSEPGDVFYKQTYTILFVDPASMLVLSLVVSGLFYLRKKFGHKLRNKKVLPV